MALLKQLEASCFKALPIISSYYLLSFGIYQINNLPHIFNGKHRYDARNINKFYREAAVEGLLLYACQDPFKHSCILSIQNKRYNIRSYCTIYFTYLSTKSASFPLVLMHLLLL